jgi:hypothetical protein
MEYGDEWAKSFAARTGNQARAIASRSFDELGFVDMA